MAVGFKIDFLWYQVGHGDFLHSFFLTISYHLEPNGWGSRYPYLMNELYQGKLSWKDVPKALTEVEEVRSKLKTFIPDKVIWDIEDTSKQPPWGQNISSTITSLANYFVTSDGRDLFEVLIMALKDAEYEKVDLEIESI
ncbi:immunity 70 family protein [Pontibacillus sp. HMF3514]|uniref:immunity 70 family protein n=1 Tax=Pontibacillus sp. HMF3514 TaxID=2692425 RepID=UPI0013200DA2|nr:immunity 70 family protein [Pontibacillus sp. HMF3514]QHE53675.1 hypothetical protein GS400_17360 [Pontibacillus sp. HMF3514]